jgi:hypothetical protein
MDVGVVRNGEFAVEGVDSVAHLWVLGVIVSI